MGFESGLNGLNLGSRWVRDGFELGFSFGFSFGLNGLNWVRTV